VRFFAKAWSALRLAWALNCRRHSLRSAFELGARDGGARVHLETDRNEAFARLRGNAGARSCAHPPLALAPRGFDPSEMSAAEGVPARARSPTASAESDSEESSDSEVELADPKESLRWLGYAHRVCADAPPVARPSGGAAPSRDRVARCPPTEKTRDPRSRASSRSNPEPPLTPAPELHATKRRLVALASGRRPVSDGGFTGVRASSAAARAHPRPARRPTSEKENPRRDKRKNKRLRSFVNAPLSALTFSLSASNRND
jgi:hypothetical protein